MKKNFLKVSIRPFTCIVILGFALTALVGWGIHHGPYGYGYNGHHYIGSSDDIQNKAHVGLHGLI